ncbi:Hok/Gef family protein [Aliivibrio sifiae]
MLKKSALTRLIVICMTILLGLWLEKGSLCELSYQSERTIISASLAYESR